MMKKYRFVPVSALCLALALSQAAYGSALTVPPIPAESAAQESGSEGGPGTAVQTGPQTGETPAVQETETAAGTEDSQAGPGTVAGTSGTGSAQAGAGAGTEAATVTAPQIQSEGAVLLDGKTGKILYGKNENQSFYPASITKLMTALLVAENCSLDEVVTFSETATTNLEAGAVTLNLKAGDQLTVRDCLYALLLKSANEVANGLAEHVSGSVEAFADRMNARARELGCLSTNFENPNGLNDPDHKTTPYDMALIARAAFENPTVREIDSTLSYKVAPTSGNPSGKTVTMGHKMFYSTDSRYYEGIIGGKTGYTSKAGNTLVTGAERDGVRLIAVVMKSASTHYQDTKALLDYGFEHYQVLTGQAAAAGNRWEADGSDWYFVKENGEKAASEWMTIDGEEYWFDPDGKMATGWRLAANGKWYYFRSWGAMAENYWIQEGDRWFYVGSDGSMITDAWTPDGYYVGADGAWKA